LVVWLGAGAGCEGRPLPYPTRNDADADDAAGIDANEPPCDPGDGTIAFALCGALGAKPVAYVPPDGVQSTGRWMSQVTYEVSGFDGVWLDIWGDAEPWKDSNPRDVAGWLLRPPAGWAGEGEWICGQSGTITHHADGSVEATLTAPAILPRCNGGQGGLHADVFGGVIPFGAAAGCSIGYTLNGIRTLILAASCPQTGVPVPIDEARIVVGQLPATTACAGAGATVTLLPDTSANGAQHLIVDIPSISTPKGCDASTAVGGQLQMKVAGFHGG
jgi:hypothetical protein